MKLNKINNPKLISGDAGEHCPALLSGSIHGSFFPPLIAKCMSQEENLDSLLKETILDNVERRWSSACCMNKFFFKTMNREMVLHKRLHACTIAVDSILHNLVHNALLTAHVYCMTKEACTLGAMERICRDSCQNQQPKQKE